MKTDVEKNKYSEIIGAMLEERNALKWVCE